MKTGFVVGTVKRIFESLKVQFMLTLCSYCYAVKKINLILITVWNVLVELI